MFLNSSKIKHASFISYCNYAYFSQIEKHSLSYSDSKRYVFITQFTNIRVIPAGFLC